MEPYLPFMRETLANFPTLTVRRLHTMVQSRGYMGGADYFRHIVARHRPRPPAEAYCAFALCPGLKCRSTGATLVTSRSDVPAGP